MWFNNLKTYLIFLSRNRLYTLVSVFGFSISLMFVLLLSLYVKQELSVDDFHQKKDRIFLLASSMGANSANAVAEYVKGKCPEIESYVRVVSLPMVISIANQPKMRVKILFADSTFFKVFSFKLLEGEASKVLATKLTAVVTRSFARKNFGEQSPIGKMIRMNDSEVLITGIMEDFSENTHFPSNELVLNYRMIENYWGKDIFTSWENSSFTTYFLAKQGTNLPAKSSVLVQDLKKVYWIYKEGRVKDLLCIPLKEVHFCSLRFGAFDPKINNKTLVSVYLGIAILILIVAMLNYINLSVSQAGMRGKETAIKKLLGATKNKLIFQFVSESILMTFFSFLLSLILAFVVEPYFNQVFDTQLFLRQQFSVSLLLLLLVAIGLIGGISGILPALVMTQFEAIEVVKGAFRRKVKMYYSRFFITVQYAVAISLLICTTVMVLQTRYLLNYDLGFNRSNLFSMENVVSSERVVGLRSELMSIAGVETVSFVCGTPLDGGNNMSFQYKGQALSFQVFVVDSVFFKMMGIKIKPTRIITDKKIFWANQKAFDALKPDKNDSLPDGYTRGRIAGITSDFHFKSLHQTSGLALFTNFDTNNERAWSILVKIAPHADAFQTANKIKKAYFNFNGQVPFESTFADEVVQKWYAKEQKASKIIFVFTLLTFIILLMGILSMSFYFIRQKEKEIALRKINGASEIQILTLLNKDFLIWLAIAFIVAVPISYYAMNRWLENFAYRTSLSWWIFAVSGLIALVIGLLSTSYQTLRAAKRNPIESLRYE